MRASKYRPAGAEIVVLIQIKGVRYKTLVLAVLIPAIQAKRHDGFASVLKLVILQNGKIYK